MFTRLSNAILADRLHTLPAEELIRVSTGNNKDNMLTMPTLRSVLTRLFAESVGNDRVSFRRQVHG